MDITNDGKFKSILLTLSGERKLLFVFATYLDRENGICQISHIPDARRSTLEEQLQFQSPADEACGNPASFFKNLCPCRS